MSSVGPRIASYGDVHSNGIGELDQRAQRFAAAGDAITVERDLLAAVEVQALVDVVVLPGEADSGALDVARARFAAQSRDPLSLPEPPRRTVNPADRRLRLARLVGRLLSDRLGLPNSTKARDVGLMLSTLVSLHAVYSRIDAARQTGPREGT